MSSDYKSSANVKQSVGRSFTMGSNRREEACDVEEFKSHFMKQQEKLASLANKLFGLNFWSHSITKHMIDCVDFENGFYSVAASAVVKISLNDGTYHEELGCGFSFKLTNKAISVSNACQEAKLDAFKKAIISFGYNCENEENVEMNKISCVQSPESMKNKNTTFHPPSTNQGTNKIPPLSSPRNSCINASVPSPKLNVPTSSRSDQMEQDLRAERKRKQQQLQEEYRSRMKMKEKQPCATNKENSEGQFLIDSALVDEPCFLSTQEVDEMMKSASVLLKPESSNNRMPLISSPAQNTSHNWSSNKNFLKTPENQRNNQLFIN